MLLPLRAELVKGDMNVLYGQPTKSPDQGRNQSWRGHFPRQTMIVPTECRTPVAGSGRFGQRVGEVTAYIDRVHSVRSGPACRRQSNHLSSQGAQSIAAIDVPGRVMASEGGVRGGHAPGARAHRARVGYAVGPDCVTEVAAAVMGVVGCGVGVGVVASCIMPISTMAGVPLGCRAAMCWMNRACSGCVRWTRL